MRLCVIGAEMPLTVTRGNPWGVPASIRVLSKSFSPALPPRDHPRKYDFFVIELSTYTNHNRSFDIIGPRTECAQGLLAKYRAKSGTGRPGTNCL